MHPVVERIDRQAGCAAAFEGPTAPPSGEQLRFQRLVRKLRHGDSREMPVLVAGAVSSQLTAELPGPKAAVARRVLAAAAYLQEAAATRIDLHAGASDSGRELIVRVSLSGVDIDLEVWAGDGGPVGDLSDLQQQIGERLRRRGLRLRSLKAGAAAAATHVGSEIERAEPRRLDNGVAAGLRRSFMEVVV